VTGLLGSTLVLACSSPSPEISTEVEIAQSQLTATAMAPAPPPGCWTGSIAFGECGAVTAGDVTFTVGGQPGTTVTGKNFADPAQLIFTNTTNNQHVIVVYCWPDSICNHLNYEPGDPLGTGYKACEQAIPPNGTLSFVIQDIRPGCMYAAISGAPTPGAASCDGY
jgi:hypothetical protein